MVDVKDLITDNIDIWTSAVKRKSSSGRGSGKKVEIYGVKKLRELILDLAVRGLLVPQDPIDEPASGLLERIAVEKNKRQNSSGKKSCKLPNIDPGERLINQPNGWCETRLGEIIRVINGRAYKKHEMLQEGTPLLRVGNLFTSKEWYYSDLELEIDKYIDNGDLIYAWSASFGPFIWEGGKAIYHYHIWKMEFYSPTDCDKYFFKLYLQAVSAAIKASGSGIAMIHMTKERMEKLVLPIPPLQEQHRIVAKVDELMALCDQLEQQTEASLTAHQTLVKTLLDALTQAATQQTGDESTTARISTPFEQAWQRLAEHFDTVFTTEDSIDQLKQTILQLAVMGKLVPQDPNDEPARELLKRIAAEKAELVKAKKIKKQKVMPEIGDDEKPFALPVGWEWARVGDVVSLKNGYAFKSSNFVQHKTTYVLTTPGNFFESGGFRDRGSKTKYYAGDVDPEFVLQPNDLIFPMTEQAPGLLGSAAFIPTDRRTYIHNQRLGKLSIHSESTTSAEFVYWFFNSRYLRDELAKSCSGTTVRHTSPDKVLRVLIPVLSVNEQRRIVAKVNELTTICDQLKARLTQVQTTQLQLADTITKQAISQ